MTGGAFFFKRAGLKGLVTSGTLLVEGIGPFRNLLVAFIQFMTFAARLGIRIFIFGQRMVTVTARQSITGDIMMFFVLKNDISRSDFKLHPDRITGCLGWKRRVTQNPHKQKVNYQTVCQF